MRYSLLIFAALAAYVAANTNEKKIVCYFGSWAVYRPGNGQFQISYIDPNLCTHLIYTFVGLSQDGDVRILDPWADLPKDGGKDGFNKFNKIKEENTKLKTMVAIGGWNEGSTKYSQLAGDSKKREKFVENVVKFVKKYDFDGFDFDWEYPNQRGGKPQDRKNFVILLKMLRKRFDEEGLILSSAVGAAEVSASKSYEIAEVSKYLHFINLMAYDLHGAWDKSTGINAPLYPRSGEKTESQRKLNVNASVHYWISNGAPPEKIILGIPLYGRTFTLESAKKNGLGATAWSAGQAGPYTREPGNLGYNEICEKFKNEKWNIKFEKEQMVPYAFKGTQWVGYEDEKSVAIKADYIKKMGLGGGMVWSIETDDFKGLCGKKYPLLNTLKRVLNEEEVESEEPSKTTTKKPEEVTEPEQLVPSEGTSEAPVEEEGDLKKIVCYFGSWTVYRKGKGHFEIGYINPKLCTHLIYTFVGIAEDGNIRILDSWADLPNDGGKNGFNKFNDLRNKNPHLKTMIAIGGWNEGSRKYSEVAGNPKKREMFVENVVKFVKKYNFNGFDFDWEYPNQRGGKYEDKNNFVELLKALRERFDEEGLILSSAVGAAEVSASQSYNIADVSKYLHFINLMAYDLHGSWDRTTGINAPLYSKDKLSVNESVHYWLSQGAPPEKIVVGIPLYGRTFTLQNEKNNKVGAPATGPGAAGPYTREPGMWGYNEICEKLQTEKWSVRFQKDQLVPYAVKDNQWVGYDNEMSVKHKAQYIKKMGLGGAMIWSIETDDFKGVCGKKYPLLTVLNTVLRGKVNVTEDETTEDGHEDIENVTEPESEDTTCTDCGTVEEESPTVHNPCKDVCEHSGFGRCSYDCTKFYRCKIENGTYHKYDFDCPEGLQFDLEQNVCNWPGEVECTVSEKPSDEHDKGKETHDETATNEGIATEVDKEKEENNKVPKAEDTTCAHCGTVNEESPKVDNPCKDSCKHAGFRRCSYDCTKFYICRMEKGTYHKYDFVCPQGLHFDLEGNVCKWPGEVDCTVIEKPKDEGNKGQETHDDTVKDEGNVTEVNKEKEENGKKEEYEEYDPSKEFPEKGKGEGTEILENGKDKPKEQDNEEYDIYDDE